VPGGGPGGSARPRARRPPRTGCSSARRARGRQRPAREDLPHLAVRRERPDELQKTHISKSEFLTTVSPSSIALATADGVNAVTWALLRRISLLSRSLSKEQIRSSQNRDLLCDREFRRGGNQKLPKPTARFVRVPIMINKPILTLIANDESTSTLSPHLRCRIKNHNSKDFVKKTHKCIKPSRFRKMRTMRV
jgi:hypothetical protein